MRDHGMRVDSDQVPSPLAEPSMEAGQPMTPFHVALKPGDNVLVAYQRGLSPTQATEVAEQLRERFPGVMFTVIADVAYIAVDQGERER